MLMIIARSISYTNDTLLLDVALQRPPSGSFMTENKEIPVHPEEDEHSSAKQPTLLSANRSPMTVQTFELDAALEVVKRDRDTDEKVTLYRPSLPIRYLDRETFERMG
jgi:hypothetical protein